MSRDVDSLVLQMGADLRRFEESVARMQREADRRLRRVERRAKRSQRKLKAAMWRASRHLVPWWRLRRWINL